MELRRPIRHVERPERDVLIYLLWREGRFRLGQIGACFGVGGSAVSHARGRVEARLKTDRKLRGIVGVCLSRHVRSLPGARRECERGR